MEQKTLVTEKKTRRKGTKLRELSVSEKEKIHQQHLGLVVSIAEKYVGKSPDFTFEDLIQEGIRGLFWVAEKFDEQKGCRFSTYATWWIKQFINRALNEGGRTIRIPGYIIGASSTYKKVRQKLSRELERKPLIEEMAAAMGITINRAQRIRKYLENSPKIISLEKALGKNKYSILPESIKDEREASPVESASRKEDLEKTLKSLTSLTPREEKIIKKRFGLEDGMGHTLEEIGEEMGLTKEGIRKIIKKALARLRRKEERGLKKDS